jgi:hypothetical protein
LVIFSFSKSINKRKENEKKIHFQNSFVKMRLIQKTPHINSFVIVMLSIGFALGCGTPAIPLSFDHRIVNGQEAKPNYKKGLN